MLTPITTVSEAKSESGCCDVFGYGGNVTCACNYQ